MQLKIDRRNLAEHLLEHGGSCHMSADHCKEGVCPVQDEIGCGLSPKLLAWATRVLSNEDEGRCESIW